MDLRYFISSTLAWIVLSGAVQSPLQAVPLPERFGLTRHGTQWVLEDEEVARRQLATLPKQLERCEKLQRELREQVIANRQRWLKLQAVRRQLKSVRDSSDSTSAQNGSLKQKANAQETQLKASCVVPREVGALPAVRLSVVELIATRHRILLTIARLRATFSTLPDRYKKLAENQVVMDAISDNGKLSLSRHTRFERELRRLAQWEQTLLRADVPLYFENGTDRVGGILNRCAPTTFTWTPEEEPVVLTANTAQAAGISVPPDTPVVSYRLNDKHTIKVRQVRTPYLQFGSCILRDIDTYILSPDQEEAGNRIGPKAFTNEKYAIEPEWLRLRLSN